MEVAAEHIIIGNATDIGRVRSHNEDYMSHFQTPIGYCIIVCDGMGGHAAGEVASQNAVMAMKHFLTDLSDNKVAPPQALFEAIEFSNFRLRDMVAADPALKGMGTTCVAALIHNGKLYVAHAGDSRIYLLRGKQLRQLTKDHSAVQEMIDAGVMTEKEAEQSDKKNQISKALGIFPRVNATVSQRPIPLQKGDSILLCSDGLTAHLDSIKILSAFRGKDDVQQIAIALKDAANENGGSDNITVQVIKYGGSGGSRESRARARKVAALCFVGLLAIGLIATGFFLNRHPQPLRPLSKPKPAAAAVKKEDLKADSSAPKNIIHK